MFRKFDFFQSNFWLLIFYEPISCLDGIWFLELDFDLKVKVWLFQCTFDHFALMDDFLKKWWFKTWNLIEAKLRVQDESLRNGSENFGVQQLPLFNLLKPEDVDWLICLSWFEGGRWLNTRVPRNLHSHEVILIGDIRNGLTDAIWKLTENRQRWA